jgi:hypothetical protein
MSEELKPCPNCNGTGDLTSFAGEWMGYCHCQFTHPSDITLDQAKQVLAEAGMVTVPVDEMIEIAKLVKFGIDGTYGGTYYTELMQDMYFPLLDSIKAAQEGDKDGK